MLLCCVPTYSFIITYLFLLYLLLINSDPVTYIPKLTHLNKVGWKHSVSDRAHT